MITLKKGLLCRTYSDFEKIRTTNCIFQYDLMNIACPCLIFCRKSTVILREGFPAIDALDNAELVPCERWHRSRSKSRLNLWSSGQAVDWEPA
ncbi:hypothetical protein EDD56_115118 [Pseudobacteriovorax antillogorgiicola]|nr:hypothetical protein EDD56_115118 [Pseudobacteriovorax antillogorgiicola]